MRVLFPTGRLYDGVTSRIEKQLILHFHHAPADLRQCDDLTQRARESPQPRAGSLRRSTVAVDDYGFDLFRVHHTHGEIVIQPVQDAVDRFSQTVNSSEGDDHGDFRNLFGKVERVAVPGENLKGQPSLFGDLDEPATRENDGIGGRPRNSR